MSEAYPLSWPTAWPRTAAEKRKRARFYRLERRDSFATTKTKGAMTVAGALSRLSGELSRAGAKSVVISTNVELRRDGAPYSNRRDPADPGVAVYFVLQGRQVCIPCDLWDRVADNLTAVASTIDALRGIERWGAKAMVDAAFSGFRALPETAGASSRPWYDVLGVSPHASPDAIRLAYRAAVARTHPDNPGGSRDEFEAVVAAFRQAPGVSR